MPIGRRGWEARRVERAEDMLELRQIESQKCAKDDGGLDGAISEGRSYRSLILEKASSGKSS